MNSECINDELLIMLKIFFKRAEEFGFILFIKLLFVPN